MRPCSTASQSSASGSGLHDCDPRGWLTQDSSSSGRSKGRSYFYATDRFASGHTGARADYSAWIIGQTKSCYACLGGTRWRCPWTAGLNWRSGRGQGAGCAVQGRASRHGCAADGRLAAFPVSRHHDRLAAFATALHRRRKAASATPPGNRNRVRIWFDGIFTVRPQAHSIRMSTRVAAH